MNKLCTFGSSKDQCHTPDMTKKFRYLCGTKTNKGASCSKPVTTQNDRCSYHGQRLLCHGNT